MVQTDYILGKLIKNRLGKSDSMQNRAVRDVIMALYQRKLAKGDIDLEYPTEKEARKAIREHFTVKNIQDVITSKYKKETKYYRSPASAVKWARIITRFEEAFMVELDRHAIGIYEDDPVYCSCGTKCVPGRSRGRFVWKCPECGCSIGVHEGTNIPLGMPDDLTTRRKRIAVHDEINRLVDSGLRKQTVYEILSREMKLKPEQTHAGLFNEQQCDEAVCILKKLKGGYRI